jgi:hypothetical protein
MQSECLARPTSRASTPCPLFLGRNELIKLHSGVVIHKCASTRTITDIQAPNLLAVWELKTNLAQRVHTIQTPVCFTIYLNNLSFIG